MRALSYLALIAATQVWARDNPGIRANSCCPGFTATDMSEGQGHSTPSFPAGTHSSVEFSTATRVLKHCSCVVWLVFEG